MDISYKVIFMLAAETGARLGEALGLVWEGIDFEMQTISITTNSTAPASASR